MCSTCTSGLKRKGKTLIRSVSSTVKHLTRGVYIVAVAQVVCWVSAACQGSVQPNSRMKRVNHPPIILKGFFIFNHNYPLVVISPTIRRACSAAQCISAAAIEVPIPRSCFGMFLRSKGTTSPSQSNE